MSFAQIQAAATLAQTTLARYAGMAIGAAGNGLIGTHAITGVYGTPIVQEVLMPGGGSRRRVALPYTCTRDQFEAAPDSKLPFVRTDLTPTKIYRIDTVDTHQPLNYVLLLVKAGE